MMVFQSPEMDIIGLTRYLVLLLQKMPLTMPCSCVGLLAVKIFKGHRATQDLLSCVFMELTAKYWRNICVVNWKASLNVDGLLLMLMSEVVAEEGRNGITMADAQRSKTVSETTSLVRSFSSTNRL